MPNDTKQYTARVHSDVFVSSAVKAIEAKGGVVDHSKTDLSAGSVVFTADKQAIKDVRALRCIKGADEDVLSAQ